jgi:hypothetical protein
MPLKLTDAELQTLSDGARQIPLLARAPFLQTVARLLPAERGPDVVEEAVQAVSRRPTTPTLTPLRPASVPR